MARLIFLILGNLALLNGAVAVVQKRFGVGADGEAITATQSPHIMRSDPRPSEVELTASGSLLKKGVAVNPPLEKEGVVSSTSQPSAATTGAPGMGPTVASEQDSVPAATKIVDKPGENSQGFRKKAADGTSLDYGFLKGWDFKLRTVGRKDCPWNMSQVTDQAVFNAVGGFPGDRNESSSPELAMLQGQSHFIAVHLHQGTEVLPRWTLELLRLLMSLRTPDKAGNATNLFVSIVESSTTLKSRRYMTALEGYLTSLGVPFKLVRGKQFQHNTKTADFYAKARNKALEPLREASQKYDRVIMLEARYFCADGALGALIGSQPASVGGLGADAVCGMDYRLMHDYWGSHCIYSNLRETRDVMGQTFHATRPVTGMNEEEYENNRPFQVFACWGGLVVLHADMFQREGLIFRSGRMRLSECPASESEIFFRDMQKIGRGKALLMPAAGTGVTSPAFQKCALRRQPTHFNRTKPPEYVGAPETVNCCPVAPGDLQEVEFGRCFSETWDRFGSNVPRYRTAPLSPTLLIDGDVTFLPVKGAQNSELPSDGTNERMALIFAVMFVLGLFAERLRMAQSSNTTLLVALTFCGLSSLAMHVINKVSISVLPLPFTLVALQMMITCVTVLACCDAKSLVNEIRSDPGSLKRWSLLTLPYVGMLGTMMFALSEWTVSAVLLVRNTLPLVSILLERYFCSDGADRLTVQSCLALYCVGFGTLLCVVYDLKYSESWSTFGWIFVNMLLTMVYRLSQRRLLLDASMTLSCSAMTLITNATGLFIVLPLCYLYDESRMWFSPRVWSTLLADSSAPACILLSGLAAASLGYYSVVAQKQVSATCMLVLQTSSKMVTIVFTMLIFSVSWHWTSLVGCLMSLAGCAWFMFIALRPNGLEKLGPSKGDKQALEESCQ